MFVEKSGRNSWREADGAALKFLQKVLGHNDLPEELIELPWNEGGLDTILPNTQKQAVEEWKKKNIVVEDGRTVIRQDNGTIFSRVQKEIIKPELVKRWKTFCNTQSHTYDYPHANFSQLYFTNKYE